jgi:hypothetical protein
MPCSIVYERLLIPFPNQRSAHLTIGRCGFQAFDFPGLYSDHMSFGRIIFKGAQSGVSVEVANQE